MRRKSIVGLSLLAVLAFCALAAQGASAAWVSSIKTQAFACHPGGGSKDFSDAHCDKKVTAGTGTFGHVLISGKKEIETSNTQTKNSTTEAAPAILRSTVFGVPTKIECKKVEPDTSVTSFIENYEPAAGQHNVQGTSAVNFTECVTEGLGSGCKVKEPITLATLFHGVENGTKMALEFTSDPAGAAYVTLHFEGASCVLPEAEVTGSARGTGGAGNESAFSGATLKFEPNAEDEELKFAGLFNATFEGTFTSRMKEAGGTGDAITTTTVG